MAYRVLIVWAVLSVVACADKPQLVRFTASWCAPCQSLTPILNGPMLSWLQTHFDVRRSQDIDDRRDLVRRYQIKTVPTWLILDSDGKEIGRVVGLNDLPRPQQLNDLKRRLLTAKQSDRPGVYRLLAGTDLSTCVAVDCQDSRQHFLTVAHAIKERPIRVEIAGKEYPLIVVEEFAGKPENIVLLRSESDLPVKCYDVSSNKARKGDKAYTVGFPRGKWRGRTTQINSVQSGYYATAGEVDYGTSGGALLNEDGKVIGLITGVADGESFAVMVDPIESDCGSYRKVSWRCRAGSCYPYYCPPVSQPTITQQTPKVDQRQLKLIVERTVNEWLESNRERIKGPPGQSVDVAGIESRLTLLEQQKRRVVLVDGDSGTVLDAEEYGPSEAIVLDIKKLQAK